MLDSLWKDIKYAMRRLAKTPSFTATAALSLALGIGGNVLVFSLINAFMFKPLASVKDPERVVWVYSSIKGEGSFLSSSYPDFEDYRSQNNVFSGMAAFDGIEVSFNGGAEPEIVRGAVVNGNIFSILGVDAYQGRTFLPEEDQTRGTHPVAMLSYGFWQRRFGADQEIIGKPIELNGISFTVVGITPPKFTGTEGATMPDLWVPMMMYSQLYPKTGDGVDRLSDRGSHWLNIIGRLKPGVSIEQAQPALSAIAARIAQDHPETNKEWGEAKLAAMSGKLDPREQGEMLPVAALLMGVVGLVLLIACANVGNLLLMRASKRQKEFAITLALGARRLHLIRQSLIETGMIFLLGGIIGMMIALWTLEILRYFLASDRTLAIDFGLDYKVLGFTLLLSLLSGILFGLAPALRSSRPDLVPALKDEGSQGGQGYRHSRLRSAFVIAQVTLSLVLLIGAGLLLRSLLNTQAIDPGFKVDKAVVVPLNLKLRRYSEAQGRELQRQAAEQIGRLPGVQKVSLVRDLPLGNSGGNAEFYVQSQPDQIRPMVGVNLVGPGYFQTMGIPLMLGREFNDNDRDGATAVLIINETLARRMWGGQSPLGERVSLSGETGPLLEIVGVAKDSKYRSLEEGSTSFIYQPLMQASYQSQLNLVVRTSNDPQSLLPAVRDRIRALDDKLPLIGLQTLSQNVNLALLPARSAAGFLGVFGLLALILATIGLYGVVAYSTGQRTREIGIRMTLGATPGDILKMILREGMRLVLIGLGAGVLLALVASRLLSSFIYGIGATDAVTFIGVALLLAVVALLASYLPARKAMIIEPNVALRHE